MASSGAFETSVWSGADSGYPNRMRLEWWSTQNAESNSSTISWKLTPYGGDSSHFYFYAFNYVEVVLGGVTIVNEECLWGRADGTWSTTSFNVSTGQGGNPISVSGSFTLNHNSDGSAMLTGSASCQIGSYSPISPNSTRSGYSIDLPTIARASTVSCGSGTIGSPMTITINKTSSSYSHTLRYAFGNDSGTIISNTSSSSVSWTPPSSLANQIPNSSSGTGTIYCDTYNGSSKLGTTSCALTLSISGSSSGTTINSFVPTPINTSLSGCSSYIKNESRVKWTVSVTPASGAYITKYTISGPSLSISESTSETTYSATSGVLTSVGTKNYTVTVTDSRNNTVSTTGSITVTNDGGLSVAASSSRDGTSVTHYVSASFQTYGNTNTIKIIGYYKPTTSASYTAFKTFKNDAKDTPTSFQYTQTGLDKDTSYDFKFVISDSMGNSSTAYSNIGTKRVAINIANGDNGVGIGQMSSGKGEFECGYPARFSSNMYIGSDIYTKDDAGNWTKLDLSSLTNQEDEQQDEQQSTYIVDSNYTTSGWSYIKYSDGQCDLWCRYYTGTFDITTALGSMYMEDCDGFNITDSSNGYPLPFTVWNKMYTATFVTTNYNGGFVWPYSKPDEESMKFHIIRPDSKTGVCGYICCHIHGGW